MPSKVRAPAVLAALALAAVLHHAASARAAFEEEEAELGLLRR